MRWIWFNSCTTWFIGFGFVFLCIQEVCISLSTCRYSLLLNLGFILCSSKKLRDKDFLFFQKWTFKSATVVLHSHRMWFIWQICIHRFCFDMGWMSCLSKNVSLSSTSFSLWPSLTTCCFELIWGGKHNERNTICGLINYSLVMNKKKHH